MVNFLKGQVKLPPKKVMLEDSMLKATKQKNAHKLTDSGRYLDELTNLGGFTPIPKYYNIGFKVWIDFWSKHLDNFRDYNLVIGEDKASVSIVRP